MSNISTDAGPLPDGPWTNEPDHVEFEHLGVPCIIHRNLMGTWCGYAGVHPGHPYHGLGYDDDVVTARAHGGLTYADKCRGSICHVPKPGESDDVWWFGFDCGHAGDLVPQMEALRESHAWARYGEETYRDQEYVTAETKELAQQLAAAK